MIGGVTVVPIYLLGREVAGPTAAIVASGWIVMSPATVISSHVPWVHSLTPLFATITLWLLARAHHQRDRRSLFLASVCALVDIADSSDRVASLVGAIGLACSSVPARRRPSVALVVVAALAAFGYSPLREQASTHFQVTDDVQSKRACYRRGYLRPEATPASGVYFENLGQLGASLTPLTAGDLLEDRSAPTVEVHCSIRSIYLPSAGYCGNPAPSEAYQQGAIGELYAWCVDTAHVEWQIQTALDRRYIMPLVPVPFVGIGAMGSSAGEAPNIRPRSCDWTVGLTNTIALAALDPLVALDRFYRESTEDGASNQRYSLTLKQVLEERQSGDVVWLDPRLRDIRMRDGGANALNTLSWLLQRVGFYGGASSGCRYAGVKWTTGDPPPNHGWSIYATGWR